MLPLLLLFFPPSAGPGFVEATRRSRGYQLICAVLVEETKAGFGS
jgi:hypothetical protein